MNLREEIILIINMTTIFDIIHQFNLNFDKYFKEYIDSGGTIMPSWETVEESIAWYNDNTLFIGMNVLCPVNRIEEITMKNYIWVCSCAWTAYANAATTSAAYANAATTSAAYANAATTSAAYANAATTRNTASLVKK